MAAFGISAQQQEEIAADLATTPETFIVDPENWDALCIFLLCQTQWRVSMSGITGLDYTAVLAVIGMKHRKNKAEIFDQVQVIEMAALNKLHKSKINGKGI